MSAPGLRRFGGRVALVTGSGAGIGQSIATRLAVEGAAVLVNDLDDAGCAATIEQIEGAGGTAVAAAGDVRSSQDTDRMIAIAAKTFGSLDIVVNNAGVARDGLVQRMSDDDWRLVQEVALWGSFFVCRSALALLRGPRESPPPHTRHVVNISSSVGIYGAAGSTNYSSAKAGVIGLTKSLAREWSRYRITVNAVAPGLIAGTQMAAEKPVALIEQVVAQIPLGRPGRPEDVAGAVAFLCSADADYMTGQVLELHGGLEVPA
jgi:3-oxoacyl-[acyl-carrier protein] reductase